jgi:hypothetical protein
MMAAVAAVAAATAMNPKWCGMRRLCSTYPVKIHTKTITEAGVTAAAAAAIQRRVMMEGSGA